MFDTLIQVAVVYFYYNLQINEMTNISLHKDCFSLFVS